MRPQQKDKNLSKIYFMHACHCNCFHLWIRRVPQWGPEGKIPLEAPNCGKKKTISKITK